MPSIAPLFLPWLVILGLLALKPNRCAAAWWIWLPLGCLIAFTLATPDIMPGGTGVVLDGMAALAAGWGAVWLLSDYLRHSHRFVTFLFLLIALAGFSALALVSQQSLDLSVETLGTGIALAVSVFISSIALSLGGLLCRSRYRVFKLSVWLLISLAAMWLLIGMSFVLILTMAQGGRIEWAPLVVPFVVVAAVNFATLVPFLVLSSASPFYRQRLKSLLHVRPDAPPMLAPLPDASLKTETP
jgi:hypothetical protein